MPFEKNAISVQSSQLETSIFAGYIIMAAEQRSNAKRVGPASYLSFQSTWFPLQKPFLFYCALCGFQAPKTSRSFLFQFSPTTELAIIITSIVGIVARLR